MATMKKIVRERRVEWEWNRIGHRRHRQPTARDKNTFAFSARTLISIMIPPDHTRPIQRLYTYIYLFQFHLLYSCCSRRSCRCRVPPVPKPKRKKKKKNAFRRKYVFKYRKCAAVQPREFKYGRIFVVLIQMFLLLHIELIL